MRVETPLITDQLLMRAAGDEAAIFHDVDFCRISNGGETVGDDDGGASLHEAVEGELDLLLRLAVEGGGGLVEQEDGCVFEERTGDGNPLALATRETAAVFADLGVVAVWLF